MSHRIAFQHSAIRLPAALFEGVAGLCASYYEDRFILFEEGGDNNMISCTTNKVSRSWFALGIGRQYEVMRDAVEAAAACEGGCLKLRGRDTTAETYIAAIRRVVEAAEPPRRGVGQPYAVEGQIFIMDGVAETFPDHMAETYERLLAAGEPVAHKKRWTEVTGRLWTFNLLEPLGYDHFASLRHLECWGSDGRNYDIHVANQVKVTF